jgi:predicted double-glycine peptidase
VLSTLLVAGCATNPNGDVNAFARNSARNSFELFNRSLDPSPQALVLPVVHDRQTEGPSCGAHVLASVVNYWRRGNALDGSVLYRARPPASPAGYSMAELVTLARSNGLTASAVRLSQAEVIRELERGRPVLIPVRLPSIYVQQRILPGGEIPIIDLVRNSLIYRAGRVQEWTRLAMVDHYLLVIGYQGDTLVVLEPVMGYRTINADKLARYRGAFEDAAIVFSAAPRARRRRS